MTFQSMWDRGSVSFGPNITIKILKFTLTRRLNPTVVMPNATRWISDTIASYATLDYFRSHTANDSVRVLVA